MKLKTLKDLDCSDPFCSHRTDKGDLYYEEELRQEAIKWIKEMGFDMATSSNKYSNYLQGKIDMLAEFCNITKKDIEMSAKTKESK